MKEKKAEVSKLLSLFLKKKFSHCSFFSLRVMFHSGGSWIQFFFNIYSCIYFSSFFLNLFQERNNNNKKKRNGETSHYSTKVHSYCQSSCPFASYRTDLCVQYEYQKRFRCIYIHIIITIIYHSVQSRCQPLPSHSVTPNCTQFRMGLCMGFA